MEYNQILVLSLQTSKIARIITLCALYFAQGFPWGFMTTALVAYLASKGLSVENTGYLISMAVLPWTFKLFWAPIIDTFHFPSMGLRRPWILVSQLMMAISLICIAFNNDILNNLHLLAYMFFIHNCFASLQDVCTDALAVDILIDDERGKVNGLMWGSKIIGVGFGTSVMGTLLIYTSLKITILFQAALVVIIMLLPLFIKERCGEKLFPWSAGKSKTKERSAIRNPIHIIKDLLKGFSIIPTFSAALFISTVFLGSGISNTFLPIIYTNQLGWKPETYSQVIGVPGTIIEFFCALLGGVIADKIGKRKVITIGYTTYAIITIIFGLLYNYWQYNIISITYLIVYPGCIAFGTVALFSLFMKISWTRAAATMFTSYMAMANLSTIMGTRIAGYIDGLLAYNYVFLLVGIITILPLLLLFMINPNVIPIKYKS